MLNKRQKYMTEEILTNQRVHDVHCDWCKRELYEYERYIQQTSTDDCGLVVQNICFKCADRRYR